MRQLPDVPTISEFSPGFNVGTYLGVAAPAKTPRAIVDIYHRAMVTALRREDSRTPDRAWQHTQSSTPEAFRKRVEGDVERWTSLIVKLGI